MDEHEDDLNQTIKSPIKRYGSTRKIYLYNSKYWRSTIYFSLASISSKKSHTERGKCEKCVKIIWVMRYWKINLSQRNQRWFYKRKISWPLYNFTIDCSSKPHKTKILKAVQKKIVQSRQMMCVKRWDCPYWCMFHFSRTSHAVRDYLRYS